MDHQKCKLLSEMESLSVVRRLHVVLWNYSPGFFQLLPVASSCQYARQIKLSFHPLSLWNTGYSSKFSSSILVPYPQRNLCGQMSPEKSFRVMFSISFPQVAFLGRLLLLNLNDLVYLPIIFSRPLFVEFSHYPVWPCDRHLLSVLLLLMFCSLLLLCVNLLAWSLMWLSLKYILLRSSHEKIGSPLYTHCAFFFFFSFFFLQICIFEFLNFFSH